MPADLKIIDCKDLFINQSVFTGESVLIEKKQLSSNNQKKFLI